MGYLWILGGGGDYNQEGHNMKAMDNQFSVYEVNGRFIIARIVTVMRGKRMQKLFKFLRKRGAGHGCSVGTGNEALERGLTYSRKSDATKRLNSLLPED